MTDFQSLVGAIRELACCYCCMTVSRLLSETSHLENIFSVDLNTIMNSQYEYEMKELKQTFFTESGKRKG